MNREKRKKIIELSFSISIIIIIIATALFMTIKYQVEGEKNMPYNLSKIIVISSAVTSDIRDEEIETKNEITENNSEENTSTENNTEQPAPIPEENYIWNEKVIQTNDVYIYLSKNENYKEEESIKNVKIENIQILKKANIGKIQIYMPNSKDDELYKYINEYLVGASLTYTGGAIDNKKTLEICNKGGAVCLSFANVDLGRYKSNEDEQIEQGAYILEKMNLKNEDLKFKISFDLIIDVGNKAYKGTVILDLPIDGVVGKKETHIEITDFNKVVFKRYRN